MQILAHVEIIFILYPEKEKRQIAKYPVNAMQHMCLRMKSISKIRNRPGAETLFVAQPASLYFIKMQLITVSMVYDDRHLPKTSAAQSGTV